MKKVVTVVIFLIGLLSAFFLYQSLKFNDGKLHLIVCDVGQGDAIFIRTPKGSDILVDGGPDEKVLSCLSRHMPFWDRDLELVILTHPHADHFTGLFSVLKNYKVKIFATEDLDNKTLGFGELMKMIKNQAIPTRFVFAGDKFKLKDGVRFEIVGPTQEFLKKTSPEGTIGESSEFGSVETLIKYGKFSALLTGDSQASELKEAIQSFDFVQDFSTVSVLQVPHHGSRFGLTKEIIDILNPEIAAISVGKNSYGHPTREVIEILSNKDIKIFRTDQNGEVEAISDGNIFEIK